MKEKTSNTIMETQLHLLSTINKVAPDPKLYAAIKQRIKQQQEQVVPWALLSAVAAIFVLMLSVEIFVTSTSSLSDSEDISALVSINSNTIYDDY